MKLQVDLTKLVLNPVAQPTQAMPAESGAPAAGNTRPTRASGQGSAGVGAGGQQVGSQAHAAAAAAEAVEQALLQLEPRAMYGLVRALLGPVHTDPDNCNSKKQVRWVAGASDAGVSL